jgi:polar amino acid transport system permease protein
MFLSRRTRFGALDFGLIALLAVAAAWFAWRVSVQVDYDWNWSVVGNFILRFDEDTGWTANLLLEGLFTTIRLSLWTMVLAFVAGTIAGLMRSSRRLLPRLLARTYVEFVRNTPPLVLVFIFYFFVGDQIMTFLRVEEFVYSLSEEQGRWLALFYASPSRVAGFSSALLTLALYEGAFIAEIVRAGIASVERGQWEAAWALGLSPWQRMRWVILPQAFRRMVPPFAGQFISTIKDSAIVSIISVPELTFQGMEVMATTYRTFEIWLTVLGMYFVLCFTLSMASRRLEAKYS